MSNQQGQPAPILQHYGRFNNYSPRMFLSDVARSAMPAPVSIADRVSGGRITNLIDRVTGATMDRARANEAAYMRDLIRNDPGYQQYGNSFTRGLSRIGEGIRNLFSRGGGAGPSPPGPQEAPQQPQGPQAPDGRSRIAPPPLAHRAPSLGFGSPGSAMIARSPYGSSISGDAARDMFWNMRMQALMGQRQYHDNLN